MYVCAREKKLLIVRRVKRVRNGIIAGIVTHHPCSQVYPPWWVAGSAFDSVST